MTELLVSPGQPVEPPDHEISHVSRRGRFSVRVRFTKRLRLHPCAVPGIVLTDYSPQPQPGWASACIIAQTTITLSNGVKVTVHSRIARLVTLILNRVISEGYVIRQADTGAYNCRKIGGTSTWSVHAWALAIDVNWQTNPFATILRTDHPPRLRQLMNRYGFGWGGDWAGKKDAMHYQFMGTPAQADAATALAERELAGSPTPPPGGGSLPVHAPGSRTLRLVTPNMRGTDVRKLQEVLNRWYPTLPPLMTDGSFGPKSDERVKHFQGAAKLTVDGVVGGNTWKALGF